MPCIRVPSVPGVIFVLLVQAYTTLPDLLAVVCWPLFFVALLRRTTLAQYLEGASRMH